MATKKNLKVSEAKKIADKLKSKLSKKTVARYKAQGQNSPQSKRYTEVADEGVGSKRIGVRWTDDGARKVGKKPNSPVSAADKEKYGGKTFKGKLKGKDGKVDRRYIYTERRVDKSDKSASAKFKEGGKVRQKGSQSGNPTPSMDKVHQAKPVGWRFRGNKYRKPSDAHINRQLKLSPDERDIYFERRKDKSDYDFDRRFEDGGENEYKSGGKVRQKGSQSGNPTPSMDKVHQAKPVGWRFRGNKYRKPSEAHINRQLKLSPDERDIYFERRKDKSDYDFDRRFEGGGETYARGGVPKEFGGRYNGVHNNIGRDVEMDRQWVAKPVGYRFTDRLAKRLNVPNWKKPTAEQVEKYLGRGVYFENREDKSDIRPSTRYPSYMSGGTTDGSWVSAYARGGGVERISNRDAKDYTENRLPFKANNLEGKTLSNGDYVVLSYGYYPIWFYCKHEGKWYGNSTKYSMTTSKQMSQSRPTYDATMLTRNELDARMLNASEKYAEGGVLSAIMGDTDGATLQNVGGTTFSNADLTSHMDITNPNF
jgi:hypothetical protein